MGYGLLADLIVTIHVVYVGFVVVGQLAILLGLACGWQWVRNPKFRVIHLLAIAIVATEAAFHYECPLTTWENQLRELAHQPVEEGTFMGRLSHRLLFYPVDPAIFPPLHVAFGGLVLATFVLAPPRWRRPLVAAGVGGNVGRAGG
jgi:hypothetical protein